jgi:hypothetical protein
MSSGKMEWFLVERETIDNLRIALQDAIDHTDSDCADTGCACMLDNSPCSKPYRDALHDLDSGLHSTKAVPADFMDREQ